MSENQNSSSGRAIGNREQTFKGTRRTGSRVQVWGLRRRNSQGNSQVSS